MPTATLKISPLTDQVRLARLVAGAAARRCGVDEGVIDEVRLAVGEACARAVLRQQQHSDLADIVVEMEDTDTHFDVRVSDDAPNQPADPNDLALAIITSLAPECSVETDNLGSQIALRWPLS